MTDTPDDLPALGQVGAPPGVVAGIGDEGKTSVTGRAMSTLCCICAIPAPLAAVEHGGR
jgi:hypothetical protein